MHVQCECVCAHARAVSVYAHARARSLCMRTRARGLCVCARARADSNVSVQGIPHTSLHIFDCRSMTFLSFFLLALCVV